MQQLHDELDVRVHMRIDDMQLSLPLQAPLDLTTAEASHMVDVFFKHYRSMHQRLCWEVRASIADCCLPTDVPKDTITPSVLRSSTRKRKGSC